MSKNPFPKYTGDELDAFHADPTREEMLGITDHIVCRDCGEGHALITGTHLRTPGHTVTNGPEYLAKWKGTSLACIEKRLKQQMKMQGIWKDLTPEQYEHWVGNVRKALNTPEVKMAISEGTKKGLAPQEVRDKISVASIKAWKGNTKRKTQASETANRVLKDPVVIQRQKDGHAKAGPAISEGNKRSYANNPGRRQAQSKRSRELWAKRKAAEAAADAAKAEVDRLTRELAQANLKLKESEKKAAKARQDSHTPDDVTAAIERLRKMPYVPHRTAMLVLDISRSVFFRWIDEGKVVKYKKGFVYSAQVIQILDRGTAGKK